MGRIAGAVKPLPMRGQRGMTLIEIMMVVVIIGILVAVIVPNVIGYDDEARVTAQQVEIRTIGNALDMYRLQNGHYPSTDQGLEALIEKPSGMPEPKSWGPDPYLRKYPLDQWDNEYVYVSQGRSYELKSLGADGAEGGEGVDADLSSRDI